MKQIIIITFIAVICIAKLVQIQFADVDQNDPQEMYQITLVRNGVAK